MSQLGTFSFQATKTITTGEGGMVVTADDRLSELMCLYRSHGMIHKRYWHEVAGHNFRLTNLQAALGCAQFESLEKIVNERKRVHERYKVLLSDVPGISMQFFAPEVDPVLWAIAVKLSSDAFPQGRDRVMEQMKLKNIETRPGFYPPSQMKLYECAPLPICEEISLHTISLPTYPSLSDTQIEFICTCLKGLRR
jgi:perosamine synthetase